MVSPGAWAWSFCLAGGSLGQNGTRVRWPVPARPARHCRRLARPCLFTRSASRERSSDGTACHYGLRSTSWASWARKPSRSGTGMTGSFLHEPPVSAGVRALYDEDLAEDGYVWNASRLWAHQPGTLEHLFDVMGEAFGPSGLSVRQQGILVTAAASALGDSYCSLAWGAK